jgi:hypothetical protein
VGYAGAGPRLGHRGPRTAQDAHEEQDAQEEEKTSPAKAEAGREFRGLGEKIRNQDPSPGYPSESMVVLRDVADGGQSSSGPAEERSASVSGPTYSQVNNGKTVIANQGTQHITIRESDE